MPENFLQLSAKDRVGVIRTAAFKSGRSGPLMEKDVWVVWALSTLFESPLGSHLVFKVEPPSPRRTKPFAGSQKT
jgi:hypothetical protein